MTPSAACAIGALLLRAPELAATPERPEVIVDMERPSAPAYGGPPGEVAKELAGARPVNIFVACPSLREAAPPHIRAADDADRRDASRPIPRPGEPPSRSIVIHTLDAPVLREGGRRAVVINAYSCPGLCGGAVAIEYRRRGGTWTMWGQPLPLWFS